MINKVECICKTCNKTFFRIKAEVERNKKINRSIYYSRKCSGIECMQGRRKKEN